MEYWTSCLNEMLSHIAFFYADNIRTPNDSNFNSKTINFFLMDDYVTMIKDCSLYLIKQFAEAKLLTIRNKKDDIIHKLV